VTDCCEPGCSAEVLCPVHQALTDLRAKVLGLRDRLDGLGTTDEPLTYGFHAGAYDALSEVLALISTRP